MANIDPPVHSVSPATGCRHPTDVFVLQHFAASFRGYFESVIVELTEKSVQADAGLRNMMRYLASRVAHYSEFHRIAHFAGNLDHLKVAYANSDAEAKPILLRQFDAIVSQLNDGNGVAKETFANRLENDLSAVLSASSAAPRQIARLGPAVFDGHRLRPKLGTIAGEISDHILRLGR